MSSLRDLAERWASAKPAERANAQSYLIELSHALGVEPPRPAGSGYEFEYPVKVVSRSGEESTNFVDLYKAGFFALEAKDQAESRSDELLLRKAFGQVRNYAAHVPHARPPYLMVLDVGRTLMVWDHWSGDYGGFGQGRRVDLRTLADRPEDADLLRAIWTDPQRLDPRSRAEAVTREIAEQLARLAAELEAGGFAHERVARFLMRCVFTMFAEDVGLLQGEPFRRVLDEAALESPREFVPLAEELWRAMDQGDRFLLKKLLRFNGHFFKEAEALPLDRKALALLLRAAQADWTHVEPTIFGTLLTRALDPEKRHRLGAEYTPREFVERVVRPTVEQPIRERWTAVQAEVLQLRERGRPRDRKDAERRLREFHDWLRSLRFLDPACGSGNFLYVTMHLVKRIELEVVREIEELTGSREIRLAEVGPWQFHGIEVDAWPREIAELTLWIGFHQFWKAHHDVQPPEPILQDTGTLELRDAVLTWDRIEDDPERARPDPTPRIKDTVSGRLVPDPASMLPYYVFAGADEARWPDADFIIGNPPYLGNKRMREVFGDGYVDALRSAYPHVPESADYVMYWWHKAARAVATGQTIRAGLITTNSITQSFNRAVVEAALEKGVELAWAVADHPWVDESGSAAVRVAMTVIAHGPTRATLVRVDDTATVTAEVLVPRINADLSGHADVATAAGTRLLANRGLASNGFSVYGRGFILERPEAERLLTVDASHRDIIKEYLGGIDLTRRGRDLFVIDFGLMEEAEARGYPVLYDIVRTRVKPERDANKRASRRNYWWRFGEPCRVFREATEGLGRFIATAYVSKHRFFTFLDGRIAPDHGIIWVASDSAYHLGILSSGIHQAWALAAGGRLGKGNDPRYNASLCFDPFPFPTPPARLSEQIADAAERLDQHRREALTRSDKLTMTGMYNVLEKLRSGEDLTAVERRTYELGACGVLKDLHDQLDALVAEAYGWTWPLLPDEVLSRLVTLHEERHLEETTGTVRWLRPEYQLPRFGTGIAAAAEDAVPEGGNEADEIPSWPSSTIEQIQALQDLVLQAPRSVEEAASRFRGARREIVERHLDTLSLMGEVQKAPSGHYQWITAPP